MDPSYYGGRDPYSQMRMRRFERHDGYDAKADIRPRAKFRGRTAVKKAERPPSHPYFSDQAARADRGEIEERPEFRTYSALCADVAERERRGRDFARARDRGASPVRREWPEMPSLYTDQGTYGPGDATGVRGGAYEIQERPYREKSKRDISNHRLYERRAREEAECRECAPRPKFDSVPFSSSNHYYGDSPKRSDDSHGNGGRKYGRSPSRSRTPPRGVSPVTSYKFGYGGDSRGPLREEDGYGNRTPQRGVSPVTGHESGYYGDSRGPMREESGYGSRTPPWGVSHVTGYESRYGGDSRGRMPKGRSYGAWEYGAM